MAVDMPQHSDLTPPKIYPFFLKLVFKIKKKVNISFPTHQWETFEGHQDQGQGRSWPLWPAYSSRPACSQVTLPTFTRCLGTRLELNCFSPYSKVTKIQIYNMFEVVLEQVSKFPCYFSCTQVSPITFYLKIVTSLTTSTGQFVKTWHNLYLTTS